MGTFLGCNPTQDMFQPLRTCLIYELFRRSPLSYINVHDSWKHYWKISTNFIHMLHKIVFYFNLSLKHHHSSKNDGWKTRWRDPFQKSGSHCWMKACFSHVLWWGTHYSWIRGRNQSPRVHSHHTEVHPAMFYVTCAIYEYLRRLKKTFSLAVEWLHIVLNYYKRTVTGRGGLYSIFMHHCQHTQTQWLHLSCLLIGATAECHKMRICHGT